MEDNFNRNPIGFKAELWFYGWFGKTQRIYHAKPKIGFYNAMVSKILIQPDGFKEGL